MLTHALTGTTTNATPTTIGSVPVPDGHLAVVTVEILGLAGIDSGLFVKKARVSRSGVTLTFGNIVDVVAADRTAGAALWAATLIAGAGGATVDVQVTGTALLTVAWAAKAETWRMK